MIFFILIVNLMEKLESYQDKYNQDKDKFYK